MKNIPLLILGKRQSGKTTALLNFAKSANIPVIVPIKIQGRRFEEAGIKTISSLCLPVKGLNQVVIDEFSYCKLDKLADKVEILALTDDINNFHKIGKELKQRGYLIK